MGSLAQANAMKIQSADARSVDTDFPVAGEPPVHGSAAHQLSIVSGAAVDASVVSGKEFPLLSFGSEDHAKGTIVIIPGDASSAAEAERRFRSLESDFPIIVTGQSISHPDELPGFVTQLAEGLKSRKAKRLSVIGFGWGAAAVLRFTIENKDLVRRAMLVDPILRGPVTFSERLINAVERFVPMGLPIYRKAGVYDMRPQMHRLRCPTYLVWTSAVREAATRAGDSAAYECDSRLLKPLLSRIPNMHTIEFAGAVDGSDSASTGRVLDPNFVKLVQDFLEVPAKRSQKGLS